ncbi:hypothetical protein Glove_228g125 [Diversispora epigaea]|uniref:Uncharacterized protein n=1 Tax=Diversispora epigaea TaxID=1348612 RepID=A0A397IMG3_9GLOM|nr:hypothetical protein Glove_228g125 [Diversispora epigaea]
MYMCEPKDFKELNAQMRFWAANDLYKAFCVSISNRSSSLLVHTCDKDDSLESVASGGKGDQIIELTQDTAYSRFYDSWIYASVIDKTEGGNNKVEINLQIGGYPFW